MIKISIVCIVMVIVLSTAQVLAQSYLIEGSAGSVTMNLRVDQCVTRIISLDATGFGTSPLVSGGFLLTNNDDTKADVTTCQCYDGTLTPAVWDTGVTPVFDPTGYPGGVFVAAANLGAGVTPSANILVCDIQICGVGAGTSTLNIVTVPDFDTWVAQDFTVYDPTIDPAIIVVTVLGNPCECSIAGPATVQAPETGNETAQYTVSGDAECTGPIYVYSTDCTQGIIDPNTGILTVLAYTGLDESCTITATDTANTDINTGDPVVCTLPITILAFVPPPTCQTEIALGRECPGEEIDDPAYNRPGRRGLAATCGDIIDLTVCSDCEPFDPTCLVWTIDPNISGSTIANIDDCCWRMDVGDICDQLKKVMTEVITVTDTCNNSSDSVEIDIGQLIVDIGETTAQPNTESVAVDVNMINLNHAVRAIALDIAACSGEDNLVCTECVIDSDRTLDYTCSANEQVDGSCRIVLYTTDPSSLITQGRGTIAQVVYTAGPELLGVCAPDACIDLCPINIQIVDAFNEDLCACESPGEVCFRTCGDVYPQDCIGGICDTQTCCGDGVVDLFDILEAIDIILGLEAPTVCQLGNGDVPNGMPPYCGHPPGTPNCQSDGDMDIFDILVMIDKALGRMNCCDYCLFGKIF